jgi:hypothetical protein
VNPRPAIQHDGIPAHCPHYIGGVPVSHGLPTDKCSNCGGCAQIAYWDRCYSCAMQYGTNAPSRADQRYDIGTATSKAFSITLHPGDYRGIPEGLYRVILERV